MFTDIFWLTIGLILVTAAIGAILARRRRDRVLALFHDFHVTVTRVDGSTIWGDLRVFSQGLEIRYDRPHRAETGIVTESTLVYDTEVPSLLAICRWDGAATREERVERRLQLERRTNPTRAKRAWRAFKNWFATVRDAIAQSFTNLVGQAAKAKPGAPPAISKAHPTELGRFGQTVVKGGELAYEPMLEAHIGEPVVLELTLPPPAPPKAPAPATTAPTIPAASSAQSALTVPAAPSAQSAPTVPAATSVQSARTVPGVAAAPVPRILDLPGHLAEYSKDFVCVVNRDHAPGASFDLQVDSTAEPATGLEKRGVRVVPGIDALLVTNLDRVPLVIASSSVGGAPTALGVTLLQGATARLPRATRSLRLLRVERIDVIGLRAHGRVRHAAPEAAEPRGHPGTPRAGVRRPVPGRTEEVPTPT